MSNTVEITALINDPVKNVESPRHTSVETALTIYLLLLFFIPYDVEFSPLGGSGTPSTMYAAILIGWYLVLRLGAATRLDSGRQPIRVAGVLFACCILASYVSANRNIMPSLEQNGADRGLITVFGWLGVLLLAADGIDQAEKLKVLIRRIVLGVSAIAMIAVFQFFTGFNVTKLISIPGFANVVMYSDVAIRSGLNRPASTTATPLELVSVLAMVLPLAIHRARYAGKGRRWHRWLMVVIIAAALPMTVSRTAILGLTVISIVLLPSWPKRDRRVAYFAIPVFVAAMFVSVPGMLGTFAGILSNNGAVQASTLSRTNAYSSAVPFIAQHPWFGLGFGTFPPQTYFFTDNQYLNSTIVTGFVGLLALVALFVTGWSTAQGARRLARNVETRDLAQSLTASIAASATSFATFDALSFAISAGLTFLLLGLSGAMWRLVRTGKLS